VPLPPDTLLASRTGAQTFHVRLAVDNGLAWEDAAQQRDDFVAELTADGARAPPDAWANGFWMSRHTHHNGRQWVVLATEVKALLASDKRRAFRLRRPHSANAGQMTMGELRAKYIKVRQARDVGTLQCHAAVPCCSAMLWYHAAVLCAVCFSMGRTREQAVARRWHRHAQTHRYTPTRPSTVDRALGGWPCATPSRLLLEGCACAAMRHLKRCW
jgi:hypothetical protein